MLLHRAATYQEKNHHAPACFVWVKALKPADTSDQNAGLWPGSFCDVGHPTQSRGCWISCPLGTVEIQFLTVDQLYPIADPIPAFLGVRKLDFAHTPEKHDPMLLGSPITISAQDFHVPPQSNTWPPEKKRQLLFAYRGWEMGWSGVTLPTITQKYWGRAVNSSNLPLLSTPIVFFLRPRLLVPERKGLIDSTKGWELAFPYKTGTSRLWKDHLLSPQPLCYGY